MALTAPSSPVPQDGRTITYDDGSSAELKTQREQTGGQWATVEWCGRAGDEIPFTPTRTRPCTSSNPRSRYSSAISRSTSNGFDRALRKGLPHEPRCAVTRPGLVTLVPAGVEYFLVPRDESDGDSAKFGLDIQAERPRGQVEIVLESGVALGVGPRNRSSEQAFSACSSLQKPLRRNRREGDTRWVSAYRRCRGGRRWTGERQVLILVEVFVCSCRRSSRQSPACACRELSLSEPHQGGLA